MGCEWRFCFVSTKLSTATSKLQCWRIAVITACFSDTPTTNTYTWWFPHRSPRPSLRNCYLFIIAVVILGATSIKQYHVLNDKRHVITKDSRGDVAIYDVLTASVVKQLGQVNIDEEIKKRSQTVFVPSWFTVDLKIGVRFFGIILFVEMKVTWFNANWVWFRAPRWVLSKPILYRRRYME